MKNIFVMIPLLIGALCLNGCGQPAEALKENAPTSATGDATAAPVGDVDAAKSASAKVREIGGSGKTAANVEAKVSLTLRGRTATGQLLVGGKTLQLTGILDGSTLRCWMATAAEPTQMWRGNLIATETQGKFAGTFRFSNDAGQEVVAGNWASL